MFDHRLAGRNFYTSRRHWAGISAREWPSRYRAPDGHAGDFRSPSPPPSVAAVVGIVVAAPSAQALDEANDADAEHRPPEAEND
jgi:hypothetical protein